MSSRIQDSGKCACGFRLTPGFCAGFEIWGSGFREDQRQSGYGGTPHGRLGYRQCAVDAHPLLWDHQSVETTLEIPDAIFRRAKSKAAQQGIPLRQYVSEAEGEKLEARSPARQKARMKLAGSLRHLRRQTARINTLIEREFENRERTQESAMPAVCYRQLPLRIAASMALWQEGAVSASRLARLRMRRRLGRRGVYCRRGLRAEVVPLPVPEKGVVSASRLASLRMRRRSR